MMKTTQEWGCFIVVIGGLFVASTLSGNAILGILFLLIGVILFFK